MPTAQKYGGRRVATEPLPDVRKSAAQTTLSTGVGVEQAKIAGARAIGDSAEAITRMGGQFAAVALQEREKAILAADFENDNKLALWTHTATYGDAASGTPGWRDAKGKDAMAVREQVSTAFNKYADSLAAEIKTPEGRANFAKMRANRGTDLDLQIERHTSEQMQAYAQGQLKSVVENGVNDIIGLAYSPELIDKKLAEVVTAMQVGGKKLLGMGPEEIKTYVGQATTAAHVGVITRLLVEGEDLKADAYFKKNKGEIMGDELTKIEAKLDVGSTEGIGLRTADKIWTELAPPTSDDKAPISIDKMEARVRELLPDDRKKQKAAIDQLRERKAGVEDGRRERKEAVAGDLWGMYAKGATLREVVTSEAYLNAPGALQVQVKEHILQEAQQAADRKYMLGQRGTAEADRQEHELEKAGFAAMWRYRQPEKLAKMTPNQILALMPEIGRENVNKLMEVRGQLIKSDSTVREAQIDANDFKTEAAKAGFPAFKTRANGLTQADEEALGGLQSAVNVEIDREQTAKGGYIGHERKLAIMRNVIDQKVMLDKNTFSADPEVAMSMVVSPKDRKVAYVPLEKFRDKAPTFVNQAVRDVLASSEGDKLGRLETPALLQKIRPRLEHAYALFLMGASTAEVKRAVLNQPEPEP